MTMPTTTAGSVLGDILAWSIKLPSWQRDALRRIVCNCQLEEADYHELTGLCRQQRGLLQEPSTPLRPLAATDLPGTSAATGAISLLSLSHVESVNAICSKQELAFASDGVTVIF